VEPLLLLDMHAQARAGGKVYQVGTVVREHGFGEGFNQLSSLGSDP
jgi:hypothetical protein